MDDFYIIKSISDYYNYINNSEKDTEEDLSPDSYKRIILKRTIDFLKKNIYPENIYICSKNDSYLTIKNQEGVPYFKINIRNINKNNVPFFIKKISLPFIKSHFCPLNSDDGTPCVCLPIERDIQGKTRNENETWIQIHLNDERELSQEQILTLAFISYILQQKLTDLKRFDLIANRYSELKEEYNQFIHAVSHDIKSPVTAILGFISLIEDENTRALSDNIKHYLERISFNAVLIDKILNYLLYLSRLKITTPESVNIKEIITEAVIPLQVDINQKNITVTSDNDLPEVFAEKEHILRLFQNILKNSVYYCEENGKIHIGYKNREFYITDTGIGIKKENLDKIFRIFYTTSEKKSGNLGMGLYICKKIVELYGGKIRAESKYGKGTTIYFSLPHCLRK